MIFSPISTKSRVCHVPAMESDGRGSQMFSCSVLLKIQMIFVMFEKYTTSMKNSNTSLIAGKSYNDFFITNASGLTEKASCLSGFL